AEGEAIDARASAAGPAAARPLRGTADGTFRLAPWQSASFGFAVAMGAGDFDGDGHPDLVVVPGLTPAVAVLRGAGDGSFAPAVLDVLNVRPSSLVVADLDGNRRDDLVVVSGGRLALVLAGAGGAFCAPTPLAVDESFVSFG